MRSRELLLWRDVKLKGLGCTCTPMRGVCCKPAAEPAGRGALQPPPTGRQPMEFLCTIILSSMQITVVSPSKCHIKVAQPPLAVQPGSATVVNKLVILFLNAMTVQEKK